MANPGKIPKLTQLFLNEMQTHSGKNLIESLNSLLEELENKIDPDPNEIYIAENIYQFIEKYNMLKGNLEKYLKDSRQSLPGNKLSDLILGTNDDLI